MQLKPWLWLPTATAHDLAPYVLPVASAIWGSDRPSNWRPLTWKNLNFPNPLGLAGGVDKSGVQFHHWSRLGAGFVEVGTVTPRAQGPNPGTIMARDRSRLALWNKMGFPGPGMEVVRKNLQRHRSQCHSPLFINVGKNRDTDNNKAAEDYAIAMSYLKDFADVFVVNISSPNTAGLRDLLQPANLKDFLRKIQNAANDVPQPILLKLSPDMDEQDLFTALDVGCEAGIGGFILTNTRWNNFGMFPYEGGGVSGKPLQELSEKCLRLAVNHLQRQNSEALVISTGGVMNVQDVRRRLELGAHLVQTYTALVFEGPLFFKKVGRQSTGEAWH